MVRASCSTVVVGNNDLYQIKKVPRYNGGIDIPANWYQLDFFQRKELSDNRVFLYEDVQLNALVTAADKSWLESVPEFAVKDFGLHKVLFSHFAYPDLHGIKSCFPQMAVGFFGAHAF